MNTRNLRKVFISRKMRVTENGKEVIKRVILPCYINAATPKDHRILKECQYV